MNRPRAVATNVVARVFSVTLVALVALVALVVAVETPGAIAATTSRIPTAQSNEPPFGRSLDQRMSSLFHDIVTDSLPLASRLFFPESAYVAMKMGRIPAPSADYRDRLAAFFRLDLGAYHDLIVAHGPVSFLGVNAAAGDAQWIRPGWCENSIGYWHVPGVRLVYRQRNVVHSVAVASLISWRGVWYVVHLGPNPRPRNIGTVDSPALGRGVAGPAGGC